MSSDFGDDSGEAMLRWAERVGERGGARALIEAAGRLRGSAAEVRERPHGTSAGPGMRERARLDLATVTDDPAELEPALVSRLRESGVESIALTRYDLPIWLSPKAAVEHGSLTAKSIFFSPRRKFISFFLYSNRSAAGTFFTHAAAFSMACNCLFM